MRKSEAKSMTYKIVEKFISVNGEGRRAGQLAVFIRFKGCNLNCSYCDTQWANEPDCEYETMTKEEIDDYIKETGIHNITLTGGEPLIQLDIVDLVEYISRDKLRRIEIETNGSVSIRPIKSLDCSNISLTMDYKLPSSGMESGMQIDNLGLLDQYDTVKFVIGNHEDLIRTGKIIEDFLLKERTHVYISPVFGQIEPDQMVQWMRSHQLNDVTLQLQLHKIIWGHDVKGV